MENGWTKRIEELEAERDADRKREYGYSQQTVDALTAERDKLEAENKRLREALKYIAFTTPGPTMKTHSEAAEQALSVILSERDKEEIVRFVKPDAQAVERERDQWRDLCARQGMQLKNVERENGELKAEKIRIEKVMQLGCQDSESVCPYWQTVKDWEKECESLELKITNLQAALAAAQGEVERLRETLDDIAHVGNYEASQRAIDALKEAKGECHHLTAYYNEEADNYYCSECHRGMGIAYYNVAQALLKTERQKTRDTKIAADALKGGKP